MKEKTEKITVLITGFEAFNGIQVNPSETITKAIDKTDFTFSFPVQFFTEVLPVRYRESAMILKELLLKHKPDIILSLGVDAEKKKIELERRAVRLSRYIEQDYIETEKNDLPCSFESKLDLLTLENQLIKEGHRITVSDDCGAYVCNHIYYLTQLFINEIPLDAKALFVHIPYPFSRMFNYRKTPPEFNIKEIYDTISVLITKIIHQTKNEENEQQYELP